MRQSHFHSAISLLSILFLTSCAAERSVRPQVNSFLIAQKLDKALNVLGSDTNAYGSNNQLLYWLDRGMLLHLDQKYEASINAFERAKELWDILYTRSLSQVGMTWMMNDYWASYRGEDFEYVTVNIFQALNFVMLGDFNEALVEARQVDEKLRLINQKYPKNYKNVYKEDAFARFLMGMLFEANQSAVDLNDAFISYELSLAVYEKLFVPFFGVDIPKILKENILTLALLVGVDKVQEYKKKFPEVSAISLKEKETKAQVIFIHYNGFTPMKIPQIIPIPLDATHVTKLSFPKYHERYFEAKTSTFVVQKADASIIEEPTELVQDFAQVAIRSLESRKKQILAKAVARPLAKYVVEKQAEKKLENEYGDGAALAANLLGNVYNLYSEKADLRTWQTLPAQIRMSRIVLEPGTYSFHVRIFDDQDALLEEKALGDVTLGAGEYKFFIYRSYR